MNTRINIGQLILRLSLGAGFLLPVMDRLGWLGTVGSGAATWGNWTNFVTYTHKLVPFLSTGGASIAGLVATIGEALFGVCLIIGFRTSLAALGAAILTLTFGVCMAIFLGISAPFNYPVFVFTGASLLLSGIRTYKWSLDALLH